jgi:hypothetical protein
LTKKPGFFILTLYFKVLCIRRGLKVVRLFNLSKGGVPLKGRIAVFFVTGLLLFSLAAAETPGQEKTQPQAKASNPVLMITEAMTNRLNNNLQVKNIVGEPMKVGQVTIIPILMIEIGFGGGGGGPTQGPQMGGRGFYLSGEARPLGFVVISKAGTKFISAGKIPRK